MKPTFKLVILLLSAAAAFAGYRLISKPSLASNTAPAPSSGKATAQPVDSVAGTVTAASSRPVGSPSLLLAPDIASHEWQEVQGTGQMQDTVVPSQVPDHPYARHIVVKRAGAKLWDLQIAHPLDVALK